MLLSQGYQNEDSALLAFDYDEDAAVFDEPFEEFVMPEGIEQVEWTDEGLFVLFESASRPYRDTSRIVNDQIYLLGL